VEKLVQTGLDLKKPALTRCFPHLLISVIDEARDVESRKLHQVERGLWDLMRAGVDSRSKGVFDETAYDHALNGPFPTLLVIIRVHECLVSGSNLDQGDETGKEPLFRVTESKIGPDLQVRMVKALVGAGADANVRDKNGSTPILATWRSSATDRVSVALKQVGARY